MSNFDELGKDLENIVTDAVEKGNYDKLGETINNVYQKESSVEKNNEVLYRSVKPIKAITLLKKYLALYFIVFFMVAFIKTNSLEHFAIVFVGLCVFLKQISNQNLIKRYKNYIYILNTNKNHTFIKNEKNTRDFSHEMNFHTIVSI